MPRRDAALLKGTRERILTLLRRSPLTANEIAAELGLTHNAVRVHLAGLRAADLVRHAGFRPSASRPAAVYELVPRADAVFSELHVPFVAQLIRVLGDRMSRPQLASLMRDVGSRLAAEWPAPHGSLRQRVDAASALLEDLGALTTVESHRRGFVIRGSGCLLAEAVHARPEVCEAMGSLVGALVNADVRECCERGEHPRCCFQIGASEGKRGRPAIRDG